MRRFYMHEEGKRNPWTDNVMSKPVFLVVHSGLALYYKETHAFGYKVVVPGIAKGYILKDERGRKYVDFETIAEQSQEQCIGHDAIKKALKDNGVLKEGVKCEFW